MPEGDTVWRVAAAQRRALAGRMLIATEFRVPEFATIDLAGELVLSVEARGKHLLHRFESTTLHSHLKMEGSWRLFREGERWSRPAHEARVVLGLDDGDEHGGISSVGFGLGVVELVPTGTEAALLAHLGPDLLGPGWSSDAAAERLLAAPATPVFVALLDQRNLAGIGNVYANELCFLRGLDPHRPIGEVGDPLALVELAHRMLLANRDRSIRVTTGDARPGRRLWVYSRGGQACRRCGNRIRSGELGADELTERFCWWCPSCQR